MRCPHIELCLLSVPIHVCCRKQSKYISYVMLASELTVQRQLTFYQMSDVIFHLTPSGFRYRRAVSYIHQVTEEVIQKRRLSLLKEEEQQRLKENKKLDLLDVLLTAKVQMHRNQTCCYHCIRCVYVCT